MGTPFYSHLRFHIFSLQKNTKKFKSLFSLPFSYTHVLNCMPFTSFHTLAIPEFPIISYQILLGYVNRYHFNFTPFPLNFSLFNIFLMFLLKLSSDPHLPNNHILFLEENHPFPIMSSPNHLSLSLML